MDSSNLVSSEDRSLNYDKDLVSFFVFSFLLNSSSFPFLIFLCFLKILSLQKHTLISTHRTPSNSWILCPRLPKLPQSVPNHKFILKIPFKLSARSCQKLGLNLSFENPIFAQILHRKSLDPVRLYTRPMCLAGCVQWDGGPWLVHSWSLGQIYHRIPM